MEYIQSQIFHQGIPKSYYQCFYCTVTFSYKQSLIIHERIHTGQKPFKCQFCSQCFRQSSNLRVHLRVHTGEKPYECPICHYKFNQSSNLNTHLKLHELDKSREASSNSTLVQTGQQNSSNVAENKYKKSCGEEIGVTPKKPWKCLYCKSIFQQRSKMEEHQRIHTGEKPFACSLCDHRCSQKANLKKHLMIHTGEKPFMCNICTFRATQKSHLVAHKKTHEKKKKIAVSTVPTISLIQKKYFKNWGSDGPLEITNITLS